MPDGATSWQYAFFQSTCHDLIRITETGVILSGYCGNNKSTTISNWPNNLVHYKDKNITLILKVLIHILHIKDVSERKIHVHQLHGTPKTCTQYKMEFVMASVR